MQIIVYKISIKGGISAPTFLRGDNMEKKNNNDKKENTREIPEKEHPHKSDAPEAKSAINNPNRNLPAFNPPVPNRAWTAMRQDLATSNVLEDFTCPTPEEQAEMNRGLRD
jgi:hypothetical protein